LEVLAMPFNPVIILLLTLCAIFLAYLLYTRQMRWLGGVLRNATLGVAGMLAANYLLACWGLAVGVNVVTAAVVGVLGAPGFALLYAIDWLFM
jgi:inhibitor of the pro-sigma K processing machinery